MSLPHAAHRSRPGTTRTGSALPQAPSFRRVWAAVLAGALLAGLGLMAPSTANAAITGSVFPSAARIKSLMHGRGAWIRGLGVPNARPLGANPAQCRSDLPFAAATETRSASYFGALRRTRKYLGSVDVTVYRFADPSQASAAMDTASGFAVACPLSTEWVCEQCDGVWDSHRRPAAPRNVGERSVAWTERNVGLGTSRGRVIAAQSANLVVVAYTAYEVDPPSTRTPPAPTWRRAVAVTRSALRAAR